MSKARLTSPGYSEPVDVAMSMFALLLAIIAWSPGNDGRLGWYRGCGRAPGNPFSSQETSP